MVDGAAGDAELVGDRLQADLRPSPELAREQARLDRVVDLIVEVEPDDFEWSRWRTLEAGVMSRATGYLSAGARTLARPRPSRRRRRSPRSPSDGAAAKLGPRLGLDSGQLPQPDRRLGLLQGDGDAVDDRSAANREALFVGEEQRRQRTGGDDDVGALLDERLDEAPEPVEQRRTRLRLGERRGEVLDGRADARDARDADPSP